MPAENTLLTIYTIGHFSADALVIRGIAVYDIFSQTQCKPHTLSPMAHLRDGKIYYYLKDAA
jgi:hypothetical protein